MLATSVDKTAPEFTLHLSLEDQLGLEQSIRSLQIHVASILSGKPFEVVRIQPNSADEPPLPSIKLANSGLIIHGTRAIITWLVGESFEPTGEATKILNLFDLAANGDEKLVLSAMDCLDMASLPKLSLGLASFLFGIIKHYDVEKNLQLAAWCKEVEESNASLKLLSLNFVSPLQKRRCIKENVAWEYAKGRRDCVPIPGKRNVLITSAIPYVNNVPHLGNIIGAVLSADVYARYCRLRGYNTLYICGTDEYGTATETKALEEGISCAELCEKYHNLHAAVYDWFQLEFDIFGRSTNLHQTPITHEIFNALYDNGFFFEDEMEQTFCEHCSRFLADRFVEGTCPRCSYEDARGDQCDKCGNLLNPLELVKARCKLCRSSPIRKKSRHLFLDLSKLQPRCEEFVDRASQKGKWSPNSTAISKAWLNEGLQPRCMTRDLVWGTSVPIAGYEKKVFYVWFDAPIAYFSITADLTEHWRTWWENPENVQLYQFMGKDNVAFHTVMFPSVLIGTGKDYTLIHHINSTEYLNYENGKFSKSRGIGVFGTDARDSGIPASVWRYYLLSTRPETSDATFTWDDFGFKTNSELLANLGNLVSRVSKFIDAKLKGTIDEIGSFESTEVDLVEKVNSEFGLYLEAMEGIHIKAGLKHAMAISALGNQYLSECKLDAKLQSTNPIRCNTVIATALDLVYFVATILEPFIPGASADIRAMLNLPPRQIPEKFELGIIQSGHQINAPFHLFSRIESSQLEEFRNRFSGKQYS